MYPEMLNDDLGEGGKLNKTLFRGGTSSTSSYDWDNQAKTERRPST